jgi:hypothetical protein
MKAKLLTSFTLKELKAMPTISSGHTDDLKRDSMGTRIWLSRMTVEDGMPYNNQVTIEQYKNDGKNARWETIHQYEAK